jgi:hypothetical protein
MLCFAVPVLFCTAAEVQKFLMSKDIPAAESRLRNSLTPSKVTSWLPVFSNCGLEPQVQLCIDYIVSHEKPVDIDVTLVTSLQPAHADMLLTAMQRKLSTVNRRISQAVKQREKLVGQYGSSGLAVITCHSCYKKWISDESLTCCNRSSTTHAFVSLDEI